MNAQYFFSSGSWMAILVLLGSATPVSGQILPDATLPNNSIVTPNGNTLQIDGGTAAGNNLFHSFQEFSLPTGSNIFFNNALVIKNIITRVTGNNLSNLDGLIRANGSANLFLLNPNGIVFGPNARLDIGGSFLASTAESLLFENGQVFSAAEPNAPPLLTINVPIGLQYGSNPGGIVNHSVVENGGGSTVGLQVNPHREIALIGGELNLEGGFVNAPSGNIELGAVAAGTVRLTSTDGSWQASYSENMGRENISLSDGAIASTSGESGGRLQVFGGDVSLTGRSQLLADTLGELDGTGINIDANNLRILEGSLVGSSSFGTGNGGDINIQISETLNISGAASTGEFFQSAFLGTRTLSNRENGGLFLGTEQAGTSGNLMINTRQLSLENGAVIVGDVYDLGLGGDFFISAAETIEMTNSGLSLWTFGAQPSGDLQIETQGLTLQESSYLNVVTLSGPGGNIDIKATELQIRDTPADSPNPTQISTVTARGMAGDINIDTEKLLLVNGGSIVTENGLGQFIPFLDISPEAKSGNIQIRASESIDVIGAASIVGEPSVVDNVAFVSAIVSGTYNEQRAGDITIETGRLRVAEGGLIGNSSFATGQSGNTTVVASDSIELSGVPRTLAAPSRGIVSRSLSPEATVNPDNAGNITITTSQLRISDGNTISVGSLGPNPGGNISIVADSLRLGNEGSITAATASGEGGNITLQISRGLRLRNQSEINAQAGGAGNGGDINIEARTLALLGSSRINANAFEGMGGNISIFTRGFFQSRNSSTTASSELGIDGVVNIQTQFDLSPTQIELSSDLLGKEHQIIVGCRPLEEQGSFIVTGRGGLPESPLGVISPLVGWYDLNDYTGYTGEDFEAPEQLEQMDSKTLEELIESATSPPDLITEATGWVRHPDGRVELVENPQQQLVFTPTCR